MTKKEKDVIKIISLEYLIRYLKNSNKFFIIPLKFGRNYPLFNYYRNKGDFNPIHSNSFLSLFKILDENINGDINKNEYITTIVNNLLRIFIDEQGLKSNEEMFFIGKSIYDSVCKRLFGPDYRENEPTSISEITSVQDLFGFIQSKYIKEMRHNRIPFNEYMNKFIRSHDNELREWSAKTGISLSNIL